MNLEELELVAQAGLKKHKVCKGSLPRYFVRSMMGGFYLALGIFSYCIISALFADTNYALGRVLASLSFSIGLVAILLLGADLFTGTNLVMCVSSLEKKTTWIDAARVWFWSFFGNLAGILIVVGLLVWGGSVNELLAPTIAKMAAAKYSLSIGQMLARGVLCNFAVCAGMLASIKLKDNSSKIAVIMLAIFSFVLAGYEHCVANMGYFALAFFLTPDFNLPAALNNMLWVTIGNIIGGAGLLGLPYWYMSRFQEKQK